MPFVIVRQDITRMRTDAIVNAANIRLQMGGGVCGAIFRAAGPRQLQAACDALAPIQTGQAVITPGFQLPARYIIHTAGPVYDPREPERSATLLRSAYRSSLELAAANHCESIAFPLISSGIYGYPKAEALAVASATIREFLEDHDLDVSLAVFDAGAFDASRALMGRVESYIDQYYVDRQPEIRERARIEKGVFMSVPLAMPSLADRIGALDEPFAETLFRLIDRTGRTDAQIYKRANLDRKLFSKIRTVKGYTPRKSTILALAIALELTLEETRQLLERAGYALSHASKFDVIVEYFILQKQYDIFTINEVLFQYDQPLLGG